MVHPWFRQWGWVHRPISWQGVLATLLLVIFWVQVFIAVDRNSHSVSDTLYGIFPFFACSFLLYDWIARHTCKRSDKRDT